MSSKRLAKEFQELSALPVNHLVISLENDNLLHWNIILQNLIDTPFESGSFELEMKFTVDYPFKPPVIHFKTRIYHPNVSENGDVCLGIIKQGVIEFTNFRNGNHRLKCRPC
jgi:ubiquitin-conjugating enzyme E2 D/E